MSELTAQIALVAEARNEAARYHEMHRAALAVWEEEHAALIDDRGKAVERLRDAENWLREMTRAAYAETGNRTPAPGVGIRMVTELYYEKEKAFAWAREHDMALWLDVRAFEKIAKASPIEFVEIREQPQATIAQDLSPYLEKKE